MALADELLALRNDNGVINPHEVVAWAKRHKSSRLYAALDWDDASAGEKYRVWQVRALIAVNVVDSEGSRRLISLSIDRRDGGYRMIDDIKGQPNLRECMLQDALHELERIQQRYARLQELERVWQAATEVRETRASASRRRAA